MLPVTGTALWGTSRRLDMPERSPRRTPSTEKIAIIGAGKVGTTLGRLFLERGGEIVCVVSRSLSSAIRAGRYLRCRAVSSELSAIPPSTTLLFIATPHDAIERVAEGVSRLTHLRFTRLAACHASGIHTADALGSLRERGATVFSFHPLQTFPRDFSPRDILPTVRGIWYGVDGPPRGVRKARALARLLGGHVLLIPSELRPYYHAACVVASNHLTTMLWVLERMCRTLAPRSRGSIDAFRPIIDATLQNVQRTSSAAALSGPIARGGVETVAQHFNAIRAASPELLPYFVALSRETVHLARMKGSLDPLQERALLDLVESENQQ